MLKQLSTLLLASTITIASWYGYSGITANGEKFDGTGMTAAHKTLPFGTMVLVERIKTGKTVVVRINDRGPYIKGRGIDLSREAAEKLGMLESGIAKVRLTILEGSHNGIAEPR